MEILWIVVVSIKIRPYSSLRICGWEKIKKDTKGLLFTQQAIHETIFSRIKDATTCKEV